MLSLTATLALAYTPAFFWAGRHDLGLGHRGRHLTEATGEDLERAVAAILGQPGNQGGVLLKEPPATGASPEVQVVFLLEGLDTEDVRNDGAQMNRMNALLEESASSLTVPFTTRSQTSPTVFSKAARVRGEHAEAHFASHPEIFNNRASDLVVIEHSAATLAAHDELIGHVCHRVAEATNGNYAALVTGSKLPMEIPRRRLAAAAPTGVKLMITRDLLTALMVSFLLFIIFISGLCCLFSMQTPRKFEDPSKAS
eukprot:scaffold210524_cov24-Tisochrysis_lutea.AAC.1